MSYRQRMEKAAAYLLLPEKIDQLAKDERAYKREGAPATKRELEAFLRGEKNQVDVQIKPLNFLYWMTQDDLNAIANSHPHLFREALSKLWSEQEKFLEADNFWRILDPVLASLPEDKQKRFASINARASITSYFLFVASPETHPFYRASFAAKAIQRLYDKSEGLDTRSISLLLQDFVSRCRYVRREWEDQGLMLEDMADVQSALYILAQEYFK